MKNIKRARLPYRLAPRPYSYYDDDEAPAPIIFFPAPIETDEYIIVPPPRHKKLSRADYERLRLSEANIDDARMYGKLEAKSKKEGFEFVKLLVDELVKVVPNDYLNHLIKHYYRIKAQTGPTGPSFWTDEKLEEFAEYANQIEALAVMVGYRRAIERILPGMSKDNYEKVRLRTERAGYKIERARKRKANLKANK